MALIAEKGAYTEAFDERYRLISEEIKQLKEEQEEDRRKRILTRNYEQRVKDMDAFMKEDACRIQELDNELVRRVIANIKVVSADKLLIQFQSRIVVEQEISYDKELGRNGKKMNREVIPACKTNLVNLW